MKWFVGPRQCGKTTRLIYEMLDSRKNSIFVGATWRMARFASDTCRDILQKHNVPFEFKIDDARPGISFVIKHSGEHVFTMKFMSSEELLEKQGLHADVPKYIDDADALLESTYRCVMMVSGTGPNYSWGTDKDFMDRHMHLLESAEKQMSPGQFEHEMLCNWGRKK